MMGGGAKYIHVHNKYMTALWGMGGKAALMGGMRSRVKTYTIYYIYTCIHILIHVYILYI